MKVFTSFTFILLLALAPACRNGASDAKNDIEHYPTRDTNTVESPNAPVNDSLRVKDSAR
jgi:hypothetical protein